MTPAVTQTAHAIEVTNTETKNTARLEWLETRGEYLLTVPWVDGPCRHVFSPEALTVLAQWVVDRRHPPLRQV